MITICSLRFKAMLLLIEFIFIKNGKFLFLVLKVNGKLCAPWPPHLASNQPVRYTWDSFTFLCQIYSIPSLSHLRLCLCSRAFMDLCHSPPPPPNLQYGAGSTVVPSHCFWDPCGREEIKEQRSWPINFKWDNSVKKNGLLRGPVSFFCLSVLCKDLLRREVFLLLPVVVPDCFPHLHVTLGRTSVIVAFSSNNIHQQLHHTCWKFYFQMYNLWKLCIICLLCSKGIFPILIYSKKGKRMLLWENQKVTGCWQKWTKSWDYKENNF